MHPCAVGDLVHPFLCVSQGEADDTRVSLAKPCENRTVGGVTTGREHLFRVCGCGDAFLGSASMDCLQYFGARSHADDRLPAESVVGSPIGVDVRLAHDVRVLSGNAAYQERCDVELLPDGQIFPNDHSNLRIAADWRGFGGFMGELGIFHGGLEGDGVTLLWRSEASCSSVDRAAFTSA